MLVSTAASSSLCKALLVSARKLLQAIQYGLQASRTSAAGYLCHLRSGLPQPLCTVSLEAVQTVQALGDHPEGALQAFALATSQQALWHSGGARASVAGYTYVHKVTRLQPADVCRSWRPFVTTPPTCRSSAWSAQSSQHDLSKANLVVGFCPSGTQPHLSNAEWSAPRIVALRVRLCPGVCAA